MQGSARMWVVGATSLLGWTVASLRIDGLEVSPCCSRHSRHEATRGWTRLNAEEPGAWEGLAAAKPDYVVYCGGVCDVERCEADPEFARRINVEGVRAMLDALPATSRLVYCSSDHVFAGGAGVFTESTVVAPISVYGATRVEAERMVLKRRPDSVVARVALPIGPSMNGRIGHLDWLRYRHARRLPMTVIAGEHRAAVWADDAARRIIDLARSDVRGIRHLGADRPCPRPELAAHLCGQLGIEPAYCVVDRRDLPRPHLGRIDLRSELSDPLAVPLAAPVGSAS